MPGPYGTREEWLTAAIVELDRILFKPNELELPKEVRIACGPCPGKALGVCYDPECSDKGYSEIFIAPGCSDPIEILATTAHELCHAVVGHDEKHGPKFKAAVYAIGLEGKATATYALPGGELHGKLQEIAVTLGEYPHAPIRKKEKPKKPHAWITFCMVGNEDEFMVRANKNVVKEFGPPKDYNGIDMVPKDPSQMEDEDGDEEEKEDEE